MNILKRFWGALSRQKAPETRMSVSLETFAAAMDWKGRKRFDFGIWFDHIECDLMIMAYLIHIGELPSNCQFYAPLPEVTRTVERTATGLRCEVLEFDADGKIMLTSDVTPKTKTVNIELKPTSLQLAQQSAILEALEAMENEQGAQNGI